jgi:sugar phosphate isomerase/epimerase
MAQPEIEWSQETIDHGITALEHLGAFAAQLGMKLLLKASSTEAGQPARLIEMLTAGRFRTVMLALNTAEASIAPGLQNAFAEAGDRLQALYLADLGTLSGLWPGTGLVDWPQVRALAKTLPGDAALVLETEPDSRRSRAEVRQLIQKAFELVS